MRIHIHSVTQRYISQRLILVLLAAFAVLSGVSQVCRCADAASNRVSCARDHQDFHHGKGAETRASEAGFQFQAVMGGETEFGGSEVVAVTSRTGNSKSRYRYKLLATSKTSTMQKELQQAAEEGFEYRGQTVFKSAFGGEEVVCILERDTDSAAQRSEVQAGGDFEDIHSGKRNYAKPGPPVIR